MADVKWPYVMREVNGQELLFIDPKGLHLIEMKTSEQCALLPQGKVDSDNLLDGLQDFSPPDRTHRMSSEVCILGK
jgi:hypothetical protein